MTIHTHYIRYFILLFIVNIINPIVKATEGNIILNNQMPSKDVSAIATQRVVLKPGFHAAGASGRFDAKIGSITSIYPAIPVAEGSGQLLSPGVNEYAPDSRNYIRNTVPMIAVSDATLLNSSNSLITVDYSDGLGRLCMTVKKGITPGKKDIASVANYDCYGQLSNQWLPAPVSSTSAPEPGMAMQEAKNFYADIMPYATITRTTDMQGADNLEGPEGGQLCAAGEEWHNANKTQKKEYLTNSYDDPQLMIRQYRVDGNNNVVLYADRLNQLEAKAIQSTDEDGHLSLTFTDSWGRTILQRTINNEENYDTYYVYDDMGNLRYVLSPEASDLMDTPGESYSLEGVNTTGNALSQYGFAYQYDTKGRCIAKKLPGKDWIKMVYDQANRLAFTQDGNQHSIHQWTFYKYDRLDRLIQSGTTESSDDATTIQSVYNEKTAVESYDPVSGYTSENSMGTNQVVLTQNFYDNYNFMNLTAYAGMKENLSYSPEEGYGTPYSHIVEGEDIATRGMLTGTTVAMLDNSSTLVTTLYYDDRGQVIQSKSNNQLNGYEKNYIAYNFAGQPVANKHVHTGPGIPVTEAYTMKYDHGARLVSVRHSLNGLASLLMDSLVYDELGRASQKIIHGGMNTTAYAYNIHNQLKSITSSRFTETLHYQDNSSGTPTYNGNISSITYGNGSQYNFTYDGLNRLKSSAYSEAGNSNNDNAFSENNVYDKNGNVQQLTRSGLAYDLNTSGGVAPVVKHNLDELSMVYAGNQLVSTTDANNTTQYKSIGVADFADVQDAAHPDDPEYRYDANGNCTADLNKGIAWTAYNLLNLPQKIQMSNGNKAEYSYDAAGVKRKAYYIAAQNTMQIPLGATGTENTNNIKSTFKVDYCGQYVYENDVLARILTPEGYIQVSGTNAANWRYAYNLKDHLGNSRVQLLSDNAGNTGSTVCTVASTTEYYPSGMEIRRSDSNSSGTNPYLYGGKELERMHGLNEYDFSARWYDYAVPAFTTPDPLAEYHFSESPYVYCGGNPINYIDPTGLDWYWNTETDVPFWIEGNKDNSKYKNHAENLDRKFGMNIYHFLDNNTIDVEMPDAIVTPSSYEGNTNEVNNSLYGFAASTKTNDDINDDKQGSRQDIRHDKEDGNSGVANKITNVLDAGRGLIENSLAKDAKAAIQGSAKAKEIAEATSKFATSTVMIKLAGKVIGVTSAINHGVSFYQDIKKGDMLGVALNGGKIMLDIVFFAAKSNPVMIGASVVYGFADYYTSDI